MNQHSKIYYMKWTIGSHSKFSGNICNSLIQSINSGMLVTQFFMGNPRSFNRYQATDEDIQKSIKLLEKFPMYVFTHFPYIASLTGSTKQLAWAGNEEQDNKTLNMLKHLEYEINTVGKFGHGVIIHPNSNPNRKEGLLTVAKSINKINFEGNSKLLIENCSAEGDKLAKDFKEIKIIIDNIDEDKIDNVRICLDTCHIFAAGIYDISKITEIDRMFTEFDNLIGMKFLSLIHLNDSKTPFGSHIDRHACLMDGFIWTKDVLLYFLNKCESLNIPLVLETEESDLLKLFNL